MADPGLPAVVDLAAMSAAERRRLHTLLAAREQAIARRKIDSIFPDDGPLRRELYPRHVAFMAAGVRHRERLMIAGNRTGKTMMGAYEIALHATGEYPPWWTGRRFDCPVTCWVTGESGRDVRDSLQLLLLGAPGKFGTGLLPGDAIVRQTPRPGVSDAIDTIYIHHSTGAMKSEQSTITFKSYDQGRESFQAASVHVIWFDEEPPLSIYSEGLMRTATTGGLVICTFTPLRGLSDVVMMFMPDGQAADAGGHRYVTGCTWDDIPHLTAEAKADLLRSIPPHQRDARTKGIPQLGSGAIYPISEDDFVVQPFDIPAYWPRGFGLDVGWNRTAAVWGAWDRETDTVYLYAEHYQGQAEPAVHAAAIKARGAWMFGVIDPASRGRQQADGQQLLGKYRELGLQLQPADNAVEAGIFEMWTRLSTGRLKVVSICQNFLREFRIYRRDDNGKVVKNNDHALDAARYFLMSGLRLAQPAPDYLARMGFPGAGDRVVSEYDPLAALSAGQRRGGAVSEYNLFN